jgi:excisionase family DNA binding protein
MPPSESPPTAEVEPLWPYRDTLLAYTFAEAVRVSGIGRTTIYALLASGRLDARKVGRRTLIPAKALREFLENLPRAVLTSGAEQ